MILTMFESGRSVSVRPEHTVYAPLGNYRDGDGIDPSTVRVSRRPARDGLIPGNRVIVDNRVETVAAVSPD